MLFYETLPYVTKPHKTLETFTSLCNMTEGGRYLSPHFGRNAAPKSKMEASGDPSIDGPLIEPKESPSWVESLAREAQRLLGIAVVRVPFKLTAPVWRQTPLATMLLLDLLHCKFIVLHFL